MDRCIHPRRHCACVPVYVDPRDHDKARALGLHHDDSAPVALMCSRSSDRHGQNVKVYVFAEVAPFSAVITDGAIRFVRREPFII